jgi:nephrocystin-4
MHDVCSGLATPVEDGMLLNGRQLWLQAQELVYIPIKYQGWQHGQVALHSSAPEPPQYAQNYGAGGVMASGPSAAAITASMPLGRRTITVRVLNVKSETVGALELRVRPQPYVIDQTFRFHQSEHEFLKTTIRMSPVRWHASSVLPRPVPPAAAAGGVHAPSVYASASVYASGGSAAVGGSGAGAGGPSAPPAVWVRSSDPNVQCGVHERRGPSGQLEVYIKFKCGASPAVTRFLVLIYADEYMHTLLETWELVVHALQRVDVCSAPTLSLTLTPSCTRCGAST